MLAIVIPYYKLTFFEETLNSLVCQSRKDFKVYIGNDNSPENPETLIQNFRSKIDITYKKFSENIGGKSLTTQWQRCIDLTEDEKWIMILGDDDFLSENYVEEFYNSLTKIEKLELNLVRYASQIIWEDTNKRSKVFKHPVLEKSTDFFCRKFIDSTTRSSLSEYIFRRDIYLKYGFRDFPLAWGADNIAWLEFSEFGNVFSINNAIAYIRMSSKNLSRSGFEEKQKAEAKFQYFKYLITNFLNEFEPPQRLDILRTWEIFIYRTGKLSLAVWGKTCLIYLRQKQIIETFKFQRRVMLNLLSKKKIEE